MRTPNNNNNHLEIITITTLQYREISIINYFETFHKTNSVIHVSIEDRESFYSLNITQINSPCTVFRGGSGGYLPLTLWSPSPLGLQESIMIVTTIVMLQSTICINVFVNVVTKRPLHSGVAITIEFLHPIIENILEEWMLRSGHEEVLNNHAWLREKCSIFCLL